MASLKENDPQIQHGLLNFCLINPILIRMRDSSAVIERQNKEMEEWKHEADSVLVFVCAGFTIIRIFLSK